MIRGLLILILFAVFESKAQSTFIKTQGFLGNKISGTGLITEYDNHYYFSFALSDIGTIPTEYVIAKYDTLGNFLSKKTIGMNLYDPSSKKTQMADDTTFYTHFLKYSSRRSIAVVQKNSLAGTFLWNTSTSVYIEDFIGKDDSLYAVGTDTNLNGKAQQAIFAINPLNGLLSQKMYFTDLAEFKVATADSAFKVMEITALDSSLFVLFNRIADSAKYVYEFDQKLNYKNHFEIAQDAFRFLDNDKFIIVSHQWMAPGLINKGRAEVYSPKGQQLWSFEKQKDNLNFLFAVNSAIVHKEKLILITHNFDKAKSQSWQDAYFVDYYGNEKLKFKLESSTYSPSIVEVVPIKTGFLMQPYFTDYNTHIVKTDTCFNAKSDKYPQWALNFPECGKLTNGQDEFEKIEQRNISVYPNPSQSVVNISTSINGDLDMEVFSLNGQSLNQQQFEKSTQVDVSNLPSGIYFLQIKGEGILETRKIIVNH